MDAFRGNDHVRLIGHSWGGMLATAYIARHGEKVSHAVIMEPGILNPASAGCATLPEKIAPLKIRDASYSNRSCEQLSQEQTRLAAALADASDKQRGCRKADITGLLFIGLPVASLTGFNRSTEIARLKGELQALERAAVFENCPITPLPKETSAQAGIAITKVSKNSEEKQSPTSFSLVAEDACYHEHP